MQVVVEERSGGRGPGGGGRVADNVGGWRPGGGKAADSAGGWHGGGRLGSQGGQQGAGLEGAGSRQGVEKSIEGPEGWAQQQTTGRPEGIAVGGLQVVVPTRTVAGLRGQGVGAPWYPA
ncbi:uncharacterized protein LOC131875235 [Cryptomeria japonica]|uniref:uncharacterized protein LOC131875235 n=1 Tax=Cryptomeria japonica TaxID=3369 RepID=UPI0027DAB3DE|nr:uncharacterized protein LOC131875235 [Cryptomeria japonica]